MSDSGNWFDRIFPDPEAWAAQFAATPVTGRPVVVPAGGPEIACRLHGPMRLDFPRDSYVCIGFDGEGCERHLHNEELDVIRLLHELGRRGLM